jgi:hypothetical protein
MAKTYATLMPTAAWLRALQGVEKAAVNAFVTGATIVHIKGTSYDQRRDPARF